MRRLARWTGWTVGGLGLLLTALLAVMVGGSATDAGRATIERLVPSLTGGTVRIAGLSGWLFGASRIARIEVSDPRGTWLTIDDLALSWSPVRLLSGEVHVERVAADHVMVARPPVPTGSGGSIGLPVRVDLAALHVGRVDLAGAAIGRAADQPVALSVDGAARLAAIDQGTARLVVRRLDAPGTYTLDAKLDPAGLRATLHLAEPAGGILGSLARLPDIGAIAGDATVTGRFNALAVDATLTAGELRARATGTVDLTGHMADLTVSADAPAMAPRPDLSWRDISLNGRVHGAFAAPDASVTLAVDGLDFGHAGIGRATANIQGNAGRLTLDGAISAIRLPGSRPDVLAAAPIQMSATMRFDKSDRTLAFALRHPLFSIDGNASAGATAGDATAGEPQGEIRLHVPEMAPLAAAGGIDVAGSAALILRAQQRGGAIQIATQGDFGFTSGPGAMATLVGQDTRLSLLATLQGQSVHLSRFDVSSGPVAAGMTGTVAPGALDLAWRVAVADLAALAPGVTGPFQATGTATGSPDNLAVSADLSGEVGAAGIPPGRVNAHVTLAGLPIAPTGHLTAEGALLGAPLDVAVSASRENGRVRVAIERADWKTAHAEGSLLIDPAVLLPRGRVSFRMTRLADLGPLLAPYLHDQSLRGSVSGELDSTETGATLTAAATDIALPGAATVGRAVLDARVADLTTKPIVDSTLVLDHVAAGGVNGSAKLDAKGPLDALALRLAATLPTLAGAPAKIDAAGTVDATGRTLALASFQADWKQMPIRLLAPTRIRFADGVSLQGLRIGLRQAALEMSGRLSPSLDLTARVRGLPVGLAALADPALALSGTLDADATLTGAIAQPSGTIRVTARGLRTATGPGRAMPPADLTASVTLQGAAARVDMLLRAGASQVNLTGTAPLSAGGTLALRATGTADLAMTDPVLTPGGQRAGGKVSLDASVSGTLTAPLLSGKLLLANGSFRDFTQGVDIDAINASLVADSGTVRLTSFAAKAGPGTIAASGSLDLSAPDRPLLLTLTARDARALANDHLTASLDADLTLRGTLGGTPTLSAGGRVFVRRADIRVPERLPANIAVLDVRVAGARPPPPTPPPAPGPAVALDVTVDAPQQIFVRGRGVDAELGGSLRLRGNANAPIPAGAFTLRRGQFSMAGKTLTFTSGEVSFNGGGLTDPSLNFAATTTAGDVTATLAITGTASKPKIALSSSPTLPQDEVLAYLLYGERTTSLGPLEIAQIATTLASLAGAAPTMSNPLESLRTAAGLDRLSFGSGGSLEAGRYVARNVYVGAKQSVTGTGTQAVVQVDLAKGLKLEATAGTSTTQSATGAGGSSDAASVGITYQFEY
jgi:translocation and assembly module TamB